VIGVVYLDEFNRGMCFIWKVNVVSIIVVSWSLVFKVYIFFDMCWKIVLLSSVNLFVFVSKFSDEDYCHQGVIGVVLCFKDV